MLKHKKFLIVLSAFIIVAIFVAGAFFYKARQTEKLEGLVTADFEVFVRPHAPQLGSDDAKVYVTEFLDPECESCRRAYPEVKNLLAKYPGKLKLVVRYAALHPNSEFAIKVLEAARKQGKYWQALELLFLYQPEWGSHHNPQPELIYTFLPQIFINVEQLKADMNDPKIAEIIRQDTADGRQLGVRGTPAFFVNGKAAWLEELPAAVAEAVKAEYE